jgi:hypothetical protein
MALMSKTTNIHQTSVIDIGAIRGFCAHLRVMKDQDTPVEFRLIYQGPLPAEKSDGREGRAPHKHRLRKHFHRQLRELWREHPDLRQQLDGRFMKIVTPHNMVSEPGPNVEQILSVPDANPRGKSWVEHIADDHNSAGGRFVPLVSAKGGFTCSLNILFLRRDNPGSIIQNGGDIDNRIKVLLDGLRMPLSVAELGGHTIDEDEDPFYCLLEDDNLIGGVSVTTDRLITPKTKAEDVHDVYLVIHVTVANPSALFTGGRLI